MTDCTAPPAGPRPSDPPVHRRPVRSFVKRGGRMGTGQQRALAELGPIYVLPYAEQSLQMSEVFGRVAPVVLEIGFGMGHATAEIAAAHPDVDFLGVEVHEAGVGALLRRIGDERLTNVRIIAHDAVEVLHNMIGPASLAGAHIFFPDPWHKKRHHKRRLIQPPFAQLLASRLQPGARLHCATDWQDYAHQMLQVLNACPLLANTADGYAPRPAAPPRRTRFDTTQMA
ncbi:MAG: tRNA (guanosine(46)-N7)-methyltransferase TrmB [Aquabacterium sp.]|nr:tRNA (guanosine(46)-N7)-methyltransferase TrmB [Aquabacterium sp.]